MNYQLKYFVFSIFAVTPEIFILSESVEFPQTDKGITFPQFGIFLTINVDRF